MDPEIKSRQDLEAWLEGKPVEWAQAIAVRAALRTLPVVFYVADLPDERLDLIRRQGLILQSFRATFISWAAVKYPVHEVIAAARAALDASVDAAANADDSANRIALVHADAAADAAPRAAASAAAAAGVAAAVGTAVAAVRVVAGYAAGTAARVAAYTADTSARAAAYAAVAAKKDVWAAISADCAWLQAAGGKSPTLIDRPLWPVDVRGDSNFKANLPRWARAPLDTFAASETARETSWKLVVDWYRAILPNRPPFDRSRSLFDKSANIAIATQPDAFWTDPKNRSAEMIMDEVARIGGWKPDTPIEAKDTATSLEQIDPPTSVQQGTGPVFASIRGELSRVPHYPFSDELANPTLQKLHDRINKRLKSLLAAFGNGLARYPQLSDTLADYRDAVSCGTLAELDIDDLWISGAGLIAQARSFAALDPTKQVTEPLEPQLQALLGEIARLHGALIMGFAKGRELAERSGIPLLTADEFRKLYEYERTIVRWLLDSHQFAMSDKVKALFEEVDRLLVTTSEGTERLAALGYPIIRNLIIFGAGSLGAAEKIAGRLALLGVPVHLVVNGMLPFFVENIAPIMGFASSVPELRSYLEYHLRRLEIEWEEANERTKRK